MIEAHYTTETKVKPPKILAEAPVTLPKQVIFSDTEASGKIQEINTDIYEGAKKEKKKHEFNKSLYFKLFGGAALLTAGIAGINKIRKFLKKS